MDWLPAPIAILVGGLGLLFLCSLSLRSAHLSCMCGHSRKVLPSARTDKQIESLQKIGQPA